MFIVYLLVIGDYSKYLNFKIMGKNILRLVVFLIDRQSASAGAGLHAKSFRPFNKRVNPLKICKLLENKIQYTN